MAQFSQAEIRPALAAIRRQTEGFSIGGPNAHPDRSLQRSPSVQTTIRALNCQDQ